MPTLSQEELDEILGAGYASRILASRVPRPNAASTRITTRVSATNKPTPSLHIPTASLIPYVQLDEFHIPPAGVVTDSVHEPSPLPQPRVTPNIDIAPRFSSEHPGSQIGSCSQLSKPGNHHSVHRAVSVLNSLLQPSPAQKDLNDRTLNANSKVSVVNSSGLEKVSQTGLRQNRRRGATSILPYYSSHRNTEPGIKVRDRAVNRENPLLYDQAQTTSRVFAPTQPPPSPRASHTSRVLAFNRVRNLHVDRSDAPSSDRVRHTSLIATSRSIAVVIRTPPTSTKDTQLLALSYDESAPRNKWTEDQRWTLAFMRRTFHNSLKEQLQIFNTMFAEDLSACGLRNGITSPSTLESQWRDMKAGKEGYKYWAFFNINFAHWDRTLADLQGRIQKAAHQNNIILDIRLIEESNVRKHGHCQNRTKNAIRPHGLKPYLKSSSNIDSATFPNRMRLMTAGGPGMTPLAAYGPVSPEVSSPPSNVSEVEDNLDLTPTGSRRKQPNTPPKLAYRFFNLSSAGCNGRQFICGALTEAAAMPPRDPDSEEFRIAFTRHMKPDMAFNSPFLSTYASCLPPIHRAMSNRNAAGIAVIDLGGLIHDFKQTNGETHQCVFSAGDLVAKYGLSLRGRYTADTEYHVYGTIPSKYVVCVFSADRLWDIASTSPEIDAVLHLPKISSTAAWGLNSLKKWLKRNSAPYDIDTGRLIGRLLSLLGAPENIMVGFSIKIAEVWGFKGCRRQKQEVLSDVDREYICGVESGYKREQKGKLRDRPAAGTRSLAQDLATQVNEFEIVPDSQETQGTEQALTQDDEDLFNPHDIDMDGAGSDVSQPVHMKVGPWLAGLQDAARESEEDEQMDIDQLDDTDHGVKRGAWGRGENGDEKHGPEQLSPLERMAARKGLKFNKPPK